MGQRFGGATALVRKSALEWGRTQIGSENYNYRAALEIQRFQLLKTE
jgi:hypothetical protein